MRNPLLCIWWIPLNNTHMRLSKPEGVKWRDILGTPLKSDQLCFPSRKSAKKRQKNDKKDRFTILLIAIFFSFSRIFYKWWCCKVLIRICAFRGFPEMGGCRESCVFVHTVYAFVVTPWFIYIFFIFFLFFFIFFCCFIVYTKRGQNWFFVYFFIFFYFFIVL